MPSAKSWVPHGTPHTFNRRIRLSPNCPIGTWTALGLPISLVAFDTFSLSIHNVVCLRDREPLKQSSRQVPKTIGKSTSDCSSSTAGHWNKNHVQFCVHPSSHEIKRLWAISCFIHCLDPSSRLVLFKMTSQYICPLNVSATEPDVRVSKFT